MLDLYIITDDRDIFMRNPASSMYGMEKSNNPLDSFQIQKNTFWHRGCERDYSVISGTTSFMLSPQIKLH